MVNAMKGTNRTSGTANTNSEWAKGSPEGKGVFIFRDNGRYEGAFVGTLFFTHRILFNTNQSAGKQHGIGTYTAPNGDTYRGDWQLGKRSGHAVSMWL